MKIDLGQDIKVPYDPWIYFPIFLVLNILLTSFDLPLPLRSCVFFFGLVFPFIFMASAHKDTKFQKSFPLEEAFPSPSPWLWMILILLALFLRFAWIALPDRWAEGDSALMGITALDLLHQWHWKIFQTFGDIPTVLPRFSCLLFKISGSPFFNLYFPPAFFSALTLPVSYIAARQFFPRSISFLATGFMAFSYWALYPVWTPFSPVLLPLWQSTVFLGLGLLLNAGDKRTGLVSAGFLGFVTGLGYLTYAAWPVMAFLVLLVVLKHFLDSPADHFPPLLTFFLFLGLALAPLVFTFLQGGYGGHIAKSGEWNYFIGGWNMVLNSWGYISVLFWGFKQGMCLPTSGGFLNVLAGAFFFLGCVELYRRQPPRVGGMALAFVLFLLPGLLSKDIETFRVYSLLPLLAVTSAIGLQALCLRFPSGRKALFCSTALLLCGTLDAGRLIGFSDPFSSTSPKEAQSESRQCYEILKALHSRLGPGYFYSDLVPGNVDDSAAYFAYPFNAAWNPLVPQEQAKWVAVFTEKYYIPYLRKRFPLSEWMEFQPGPGAGNDRYCLGLFPLIPGDKPIFEEWDKFYKVFQGINLRIMALGDGASLGPTLEKFRDFYPLVPKDPFLQSCYFEKLIFNYAAEKTFHSDNASVNWSNFSGLFQNSFEGGYPIPFFYQKYGQLLMTEGKTDSALLVFRQALKFLPGDPWLSGQIQKLGSSSGSR